MRWLETSMSSALLVYFFLSLVGVVRRCNLVVCDITRGRNEERGNLTRLGPSSLGPRGCSATFKILTGYGRFPTPIGCDDVKVTSTELPDKGVIAYLSVPDLSCCELHGQGGGALVKGAASRHTYHLFISV